MRSFIGISKNIPQAILGKIIAEVSSGSAETDSFLFVAENQNGEASKSGIILSKTVSLPNSYNGFVFQLAEYQAPLCIGDIILLEPDGLCTVLYERKSFCNSILLTEQCECRCIMCPQPPRRDQDNLVDLSLRVISLIDADAKVLGITGGEPTLVWEGLKEVLSACRRHIPQASIQLLTNARTLKDYRKAKELAEAGGDNLFVCVSLYADINTLHDQIVFSKEAFWDTLEGIYNLERVGIPIELRTVITRMNYWRLSQWAEFVYRTFPFVAHIALMGMEPIGLALENIERLWTDPIDYMPQLNQAVKILHRSNMNVSIYNHQLCTMPENLWPFAKKSISEWKTIYLPECNDCKMRSVCGGFFHSGLAYPSRGIDTIKA